MDITENGNILLGEDTQHGVVFVRVLDLADDSVHLVFSNGEVLFSVAVPSCNRWKTAETLRRIADAVDGDLSVELTSQLEF